MMCVAWCVCVCVLRVAGTDKNRFITLQQQTTGTIETEISVRCDLYFCFPPPPSLPTPTVHQQHIKSTHRIHNLLGNVGRHVIWFRVRYRYGYGHSQNSAVVAACVSDRGHRRSEALRRTFLLVSSPDQSKIYVSRINPSVMRAMQ